MPHTHRAGPQLDFDLCDAVQRPQREAERKARHEAKFAAADLNKDGKLGRVEVEQAMPRMSDRFSWMDDNRDGFLGRDELAHGRRHHR